MKGGNEIANPTTQRKKKKNRMESTTTLKPRPLNVHQQQLQDLFRKKKKGEPHLLCPFREKTWGIGDDGRRRHQISIRTVSTNRLYAPPPPSHLAFRLILLLLSASPYVGRLRHLFSAFKTPSLVSRLVRCIYVYYKHFLYGKRF